MYLALKQNEIAVENVPTVQVTEPTCCRTICSGCVSRTSDILPSGVPACNYELATQRITLSPNIVTVVHRRLPFLARASLRFDQQPFRFRHLPLVGIEG